MKDTSDDLRESKTSARSSGKGHKAISKQFYSEKD